MSEELTFRPSDFVAVVNQLFETALPYISIVGEVSNFKIARQKWVYFDLKDESASIKCFTSVYSLSFPIEDGMMVKVTGTPKLHPLYNFSFNVNSALPVGEGSIKKSVDVLTAKLEQEGLFAEDRKRPLPFAPERVALITSREAAAYGDFMKVANERWGFAEIVHYETQVQGEAASQQIITALQTCNTAPQKIDVVVITRGGGSMDDLLAFQEEALVRAVAASRIPVVAAIGHERDITLVEMVADVRASTPSNAAELIFPSRLHEIELIGRSRVYVDESMRQSIKRELQHVATYRNDVERSITHLFQREKAELHLISRMLEAKDPREILRRGYAQLRKSRQHVSSVKEISAGDTLELKLYDGTIDALVEKVTYN